MIRFALSFERNEQSSLKYCKKFGGAYAPLTPSGGKASFEEYKPRNRDKGFWESCLS